jgi:NAD-dependent SIR2 family protein deacetylase
MAQEHGASLIEINPLETPLSPHADQCLRGAASEILRTIVGQLESWKRDADHSPQL